MVLKKPKCGQRLDLLWPQLGLVHRVGPYVQPEGERAFRQGWQDASDGSASWLSWFANCKLTGPGMVGAASGRL